MTFDIAISSGSMAPPSPHLGEKVNMSAQYSARSVRCRQKSQQIRREHAKSGNNRSSGAFGVSASP
ncbi:MAG TPA: hypothetical protein VEH84_06000 [Alphaproteobacteria bacterium]|nr:hypothetical protein [Alphaproteobacteria bacterium]